MRLGVFVLAAGLLQGSAAACLPPPPGWEPPTEEQRVRDAARLATDIVYGVVVRGSDGDRWARFRVLHTYKGTLRRGQVIRAETGWGLDPPMCAGMIGSPPPVDRGTHGVIAFGDHSPVLNFVSDRELELMFEAGLIQRASAAAPSRD